MQKKLHFAFALITRMQTTGPRNFPVFEVGPGPWTETGTGTDQDRLFAVQGPRPGPTKTDF